MRSRFSAAAGMALVVLAVAAAPALAQQSGGVQVQGNTRIDANAKDINTVAAGNNNTAVTNIGTVNSDTKGNTHISVDVKNVDNIVTGHGKKSCVNIGSTSTGCQ